MDSRQRRARGHGRDFGPGPSQGSEGGLSELYRTQEKPGPERPSSSRRNSLRLACALQIAAAVVGPLTIGSIWRSPFVVVACCPPVTISDGGLLAVGVLIILLSGRAWQSRSRDLAIVAGLLSLTMIGLYFLGTALGVASLLILLRGGRTSRDAESAGPAAEGHVGPPAPADLDGLDPRRAAAPRDRSP